MSEANEHHNVVNLHSKREDSIGGEKSREPDVAGASKGADGKTYQLTKKQEAFCQIYCREDVTITEAYRRAGYSEMTPKLMHQNSSRLMAQPKVKERIRQLRRKVEETLEAEGVRIRGFVRGRLEQLATTADRASDQLKALELLGKMDTVAMFSDQLKQTITDTRDRTQLEEELRAKLDTFMKAAS